MSETEPIVVPEDAEDFDPEFDIPEDASDVGDHPEIPEDLSDFE